MLVKSKKGLIVFLLFVVVLTIWSYILYRYSPQDIVGAIGVKNPYLFLGIVAIIGGTSIFVLFPYYIFTISFGVAGFNPFLLGICAGIGTLIGDSITYYIAYKGRQIATGKLASRFEKTFKWFMHEMPDFLPVFAFFYAAAIPLPDDFITIPAGLMKYPFKKLALGVGLGKVTFNTILAFSGYYGWGMLAG